jgi:MoxR-vWA-beta-propeller ternary system domain bpX0/MoxR-vWA-beta-propeller ternary system domain bpX1
MDSFYNYIRCNENYFWHWEDNATVLAIPNGSTIAYRELVIELLDLLSPQGLPRFGTLLLALIATKHNSTQELKRVQEIVAAALHTKGVTDSDIITLQKAIDFLLLLSSIPNHYKFDKKRILVLQALFQHEGTNVLAKDAYPIVTLFKNGGFGLDTVLSKQEFNIHTYYHDFKSICLLAERFKSVADIMQAVTALPNLPDEFLQDDKEVFTPTVDTSLSIVDQLIENNKTFQIGSLVKHIWSGLQIPVHSKVPSQQPIGGVSDLTNKGDFDRLLISEFANDDLVFLSRLANNEALFINREVPPNNNDLHRIILIDVSIKNWGTPKTIAYAIMLAIAKHPKTNITCQAFIVGNTYQQIQFDSVEHILEGIQIVNASLYAAAGIEQFFADYPVNKNRELFLITTKNTLKHSAMLKILHDNHDGIHYLIHADATGNIDVYKKQQKSKKHLQHLLLPLAELWTKKAVPVSTKVVDDKPIFTNYPLLFGISSVYGKPLVTEEGVTFIITKNKGLFRFRVTQAKHNNYYNVAKGGELIMENLPILPSKACVAKLENGDHVLLLINEKNYKTFIINLDTQQIQLIEMKVHLELLGNSYDLFFYQGGFHFLYSSIKIEISAIALQVTQKLDDVNTRPLKMYKMLMQRQKENYDLVLAGEIKNRSVLKRVQHVHIDANHKLSINDSKLELSEYQMIFSKIYKEEKKVKSKKVNDHEFVFADGSKVMNNKNGLLTLMSSNSAIPTMYIPLCLQQSIGIATDAEYAGEYYYEKENFYKLQIKENKNIDKVVVYLHNYNLFSTEKIIALSKPESENKLEWITTERNALKIQKNLQTQNIEIEISHLNETQSSKPSVISIIEFNIKYLQPFINTIVDYDTAH